mgnify:CR=1 FL=1
MAVKILFVSAEVSNFASSGGLAEVAGSLPKAIQGANRNYKVKVIMPLYKKIKDTYQDKLKYIGCDNVTLAWRNLYMGLFTYKYNGIDYYFIDNEYYFNRDKIYGEYDDGERFAFFSKAIFKAFTLMDYYPNIIHSNDWHSALVNIYLDILYKKEGVYTDIKSVFTIHNIEYQGVFSLNFLTDVIGIDQKYTEILEYNGLINLMKGAIVCSDMVTTVSPRYSREITTSTYAYGLENIIRLNKNKLYGIINGIDVDSYNPLTDKFINTNYDVNSIEKKVLNKLALQKELNLDVSEDIPMIAIISRLVSHKGINLILDACQGFIDLGAEIVVLGTGVYEFEERFKDIARRNPNRVKAMIEYNNGLSRKIYSSSDLFLMPSKSEPCGLSQMIASRYGAVPIVRATGGLFDTIQEYEWITHIGNGFVFRDYNASSLYEKTKSALELYYNDRPNFNMLVKNAMMMDFSWNNSAKIYIEAYKKLLKK